MIKDKSRGRHHSPGYIKRFITESLGGEYVGIEQTDEDVNQLWYCKYLSAEIDHRKWQIEPAKSQPIIWTAAQISEHKP
jgi:hypothetical protein